jgi:8-amino-3,8-dideoxy-alpha-D-manno-octulosonate transaminase
LAIHHFGAPQDYHNLDIPNAQEVIGKLISLGIRASWTADQAKELGEKMKNSIMTVLNK